MTADQSPLLSDRGPDPTPRTVDALQQVVVNIEKMRLADKEANDKAIALLQSNADKSPTTAELHSSVIRLEDVHNEKFKGVEQKISDLVNLIEQASIKDQKALDAALSAQKAAADKSEMSIVKLLEKMEEKFTSEKNNVAKDVADLKSRMDSGEGQNRGVETNRSIANQNWGWVIALVVAAAAIAALVIEVLKP